MAYEEECLSYGSGEEEGEAEEEGPAAPQGHGLEADADADAEEADADAANADAAAGAELWDDTAQQAAADMELEAPRTAHQPAQQRRHRQLAFWRKGGDLRRYPGLQQRLSGLVERACRHSQQQPDARSACRERVAQRWEEQQAAESEQQRSDTLEAVRVGQAALAQPGSGLDSDYQFLLHSRESPLRSKTGLQMCLFHGMGRHSTIQCSLMLQPGEQQALEEYVALAQQQCVPRLLAHPDNVGTSRRRRLAAGRGGGQYGEHRKGAGGRGYAKQQGRDQQRGFGPQRRQHNSSARYSEGPGWAARMAAAAQQGQGAEGYGLQPYGAAAATSYGGGYWQDPGGAAAAGGYEAEQQWTQGHYGHTAWEDGSCSAHHGELAAPAGAAAGLQWELKAPAVAAAGLQWEYAAAAEAARMEPGAAAAATGAQAPQLAATPSEPLATQSASGLAAAAGTGDSDMMQMMQMMVKESFRQGEKHGQSRQARAAAEHDSREQRRRLSETQHRLKQAQAEAEFLKQQVEQLRGDNLMLQHRQQQQ
jgi:hypothetical protein